MPVTQTMGSSRLKPSGLELSFTAAGRAVLAIAALSVICAVSFRWIEPAILAAGCFLVLLAELPWALRSRELGLDRRLIDTHVAVGTPVRARVTIVNQQDRPSAPKLIRQSLGATSADFEIAALDTGASTTADLAIPTTRRGVLQLSPAMLASAGIFGLVQGQSSATEPDEVVVHPRYCNLATLPGGFAKDLEGPSFDTSPAGGITFHAVRPYEIGDDIRHIHWMTTARAGDVMVRQYVDTRVPSLQIHVDTSGDSYAAPEDFEVALECAASLAMSFAATQGSLTLVLGEAPAVELDSHLAAPTILRELAGAELSDPATDATVPPDLASQAISSINVTVSGNVAAAKRHQRRTANATTIAIVVGISEEPPSSAGADPVLHVVGLDDLRVAWQRLVS